MCEIKVDGIGGIGPTPEKIHAWGTVEDCADLPDGEHVLVDIICGDGPDVLVLVQGALAESSGDEGRSLWMSLQKAIAGVVMWSRLLQDVPLTTHAAVT